MLTGIKKKYWDVVDAMNDTALRLASVSVINLLK